MDTNFTSTILEAHVRKPPEISISNYKPYAGKNKFRFSAPSFTPLCSITDYFYSRFILARVFHFDRFDLSDVSTVITGLPSGLSGSCLFHPPAVSSALLNTVLSHPLLSANALLNNKKKLCNSHFILLFEYLCPNPCVAIFQSHISVISNGYISQESYF